jgi:hypothetical protein
VVLKQNSETDDDDDIDELPTVKKIEKEAERKRSLSNSGSRSVSSEEVSNSYPKFRYSVPTGVCGPQTKITKKGQNLSFGRALRD